MNRPNFLDFFWKKNYPKIYVYNLPKIYQPSKALPLVSQTYYYIDKLIRKNHQVRDPQDADLFFVPINLIQFQFANIDPRSVIEHLNYLTHKKDHLLVALGDFSQRTRKNHYGEAYKKKYDWLDAFNLIALESTSDLIEGQDIGIIPINTLEKKPFFNTNFRPLLYSFLGELHHHFLPDSHIRPTLSNHLKSCKDVLIEKKIPQSITDEFRKNFKTKNMYELVSRNSIFTLSPAGYGRWTYRFFQSILWGSIPVLLSDDYIKPFSNYIPYDEFSITIPESQISKLDNLLRCIAPAKIKKYQENIKKYQHMFTPTCFDYFLTQEMISLAVKAKNE